MLSASFHKIKILKVKEKVYLLQMYSPVTVS